MKQVRTKEIVITYSTIVTSLRHNIGIRNYPYSNLIIMAGTDSESRCSESNSKIV